MPTHSPLWSFAEIASVEPARAAALEMAPSTQALLTSIVAKFAEAVPAGTLRVGMQQAESAPEDLRVVLQFHIGEVLSDFFFNAKTGYRAQFREDWRGGLKFNGRLIDGIRNVIGSMQNPEVCARKLTPDFEDCGQLTVSWERVLVSLDRTLSKVWFCARLMNGAGQVIRLPTGVTGPRLRLDDHISWVALSRDESDSWLDVKGAFKGPAGLYQPKNPIARAKRLHATGEA